MNNAGIHRDIFSAATEQLSIHTHREANSKTEATLAAPEAFALTQASLSVA